MYIAEIAVNGIRLALDHGEKTITATTINDDDGIAVNDKRYGFLLDCFDSSEMASLQSIGNRAGIVARKHGTGEGQMENKNAGRIRV
jgi:hypothetical protein